MKILSALDMTRLEIKNLLLEIIAGNASTPTEGQVWYDSVLKRVKLRTNAANLALVTDGGDLSAGSVLNTALATNPLDRGNHTGTQAASTISDFDTQVRTSRLDQMAAPTTSVSLGSQKITNLLTPTAASDAATKQYVDDSVAGLAWKDAVRVATTAAGTLATSFENGDTVDGVVLATGDRILIKDQAAGSENGIYTVNVSGAPTRSTDADSASDFQGLAVFVANGTTNGGTRWVNSTTGTIVLNTTALTFANFGGGSSYTAGNGLTLAGSDFNVGAGTGITVAADSVALDTSIAARWKTGLIGNGAATSIAFNHALGNQFVTCDIYEVATLAQVDADIVLTDTNNVTITFAVAPASNAIRVVVCG